MRKKLTILWTLMLVVGTLSVLPMTGSAAANHVFQAWDDGPPAGPQINNATDSTHPNDGWARMYNASRPGEITTTWPDIFDYPDTSDIVGQNGMSQRSNSFSVNTYGFDTDWDDGVTEYIFIVEKDNNSLSAPPKITGNNRPNGYVASAGPVTIFAVPDPQETGLMTLEKIPRPDFSMVDPLNFTVNWTPMTTPNILTYRLFNSSSQFGPWSLVEELASPPSTVYADSGKFYSLGINWTGGVHSVVLSEPRSFNIEPTLDWTGEAGFTTDVVSPNSGPANCRWFEFRVNYTDTNNDPPQAAPKLYINRSGTPIGPPIPMIPVDPADLTYDDGKWYRYLMQFTTASNAYTYYFRVNDTFGFAAIGNATIQTSGPDVTTNTLPTITVNTPASGDSWTGGTPHPITMTVNDPDDSVAPGYKLWLNMTYSVGGGPPNSIANINDYQASLGTYPWTVPSVDSKNVVVRAQLTDSCGASSSDDSDQFEIDSTDPTVVLTTPAALTNVNVNTNVVVTFSEPMNPISSSAFALYRDSDMSVVPGTVPQFDSFNRNLTFDPSGALEQWTVYRVVVTTGAIDDSDPGNNLSAELNVTFRTWDTTKPVIINVTHPGLWGIETGETFLIRANITDNVAVAFVNINWGFLGSAKNNYSMTHTVGLNYTYTFPAQTATGTVEFVIWATDTSGNFRGSSPLTFPVTEVVVTTCWIKGNVTDEDGNPLDGATVEILNGTTVLASTITISFPSLNLYGNFTFSTLPCGSYKIRISLTGYDTLEQTIDTNTIDQGTFVLKKTPTDGDGTVTTEGFPWWILVIVVVIIVVVLLLVLLMKRKKPAEEEGVAEEEEGEEEAEEEEVEEEAGEEEVEEEEAEEEAGEEELEEEELTEEELEEDEERTE